MEPEKRIAAIVDAAGGRLVSRVRLQKIAYLLDQLGAKSGFDYSYHHYGPYSRDIDIAVLGAEEAGFVREAFEHRKSDGARYSIFEVVRGNDGGQGDEFLLNPRLRKLTKKWAEVSATVLELAATAHWLVKYEKADDWRVEIRRRKGTKTENGRLDEALALLREAGLPPPVTKAAGKSTRAA
jgi:uncharacterized protein YwgA